MVYEIEMRRRGAWLFRWRSYVPLAVLTLVVFEMRHFEYLGGSAPLDLLWEGACFAVGLCGLLIRAHAVGHAAPHTSGRNTERGQVAESLNTTGLYSIVRNPLYLGNFLLWIGVALFPHDWRLVVIAGGACLMVYERIVLAEEAFLLQKFGSEYRAWAESTPAFVPRLSGYVSPARPFEWRRAVRGEYAGLFGLVSALFLLEMLGELSLGSDLVVEPAWAWFFGLNAVLYGGLRYLKKYTQMLTPSAV